MMWTVLYLVVHLALGVAAGIWFTNRRWRTRLARGAAGPDRATQQQVLLDLIDVLCRSGRSRDIPALVRTVRANTADWDQIKKVLAELQASYPSCAGGQCRTSRKG